MPGYRMVVASDNAGFDYKNAIMADLLNDTRVESVVDVGVFADDMLANSYGQVAIMAAERIRSCDADRAIIICGTGIGVAIAANKVEGIRATVAHDSYSVERSIMSNNCQVLTMGQRVVGLELARRLAKEWLGYTFDPTSPSNEKIGHISDYESGSAC